MEGASELNYLEVAGSILTSCKNNKEYELQLNTCTLSWLTELEQSPPPVDQIKGTIRDSVWTPEFDMKHLKKDISAETLWL